VFDQLVAVDTPTTRLIKETMGPGFAQRPDRVGLMYDQIAAVTLIAPSLMKTVDLYVDVDVNPGPNYGVSVGAPQPWPGGEHATKMAVQTDLDWDKFIRLYVERVTQLPAAKH
jgi:inosine-uridine nucleoside N-ribohydrolase